MYFAILLCIDNGPCKHICNIVEGNVVCSCLSGYTIMADGISCEGKRFRFTTETWLKHFYIDLIDLIPLGVSLRVLYFQYCELQASVQRPFARRNTRSASQITPEAHLSSVPITWGLQVKASLDLYIFLWHSRLFFSPFGFASHYCSSPGSVYSTMDMQLFFLRTGAASSTWAYLLSWGTPQSYSSAMSPFLFGFISACLENLNWLKLHCYEAIVSLSSSVGFTWHWSSGLHDDEQWIPNCIMIFHIISILNGHVWVVTKDIFAQ